MYSSQCLIGSHESCGVVACACQCHDDEKRKAATARVQEDKKEFALRFEKISEFKISVYAEKEMEHYKKKDWQLTDGADINMQLKNLIHRMERKGFKLKLEMTNEK